MKGAELSSAVATDQGKVAGVKDREAIAFSSAEWFI